MKKERKKLRRDRWRLETFKRTCREMILQERLKLFFLQRLRKLFLSFFLQCKEENNLITTVILMQSRF